MPNTLALLSWSSEKNNFMPVNSLLMYKKATYESDKKGYCVNGAVWISLSSNQFF